MNRLDEKSVDILIRLLYKEHGGKTRKQTVGEIADENSVGAQAIGNRLSLALICLASATGCDTANCVRIMSYRQWAHYTGMA